MKFKSAIILSLVFIMLFTCSCVRQPTQESSQTTEPSSQQTVTEPSQAQTTEATQPDETEQPTAPPKAEHLRLEREDWAEDVKAGLNDFLSAYGIDSETPAEMAYVVFDFDNTSSIFDVENQLAIYQLQSMAFAVRPEELRDVLLTDLKNTDWDLTDYGYGKGSLQDWADDICVAYSVLWDKYGPFTSSGIPADRLEELHEDAYWQEFSTKMRTLYSLVSAVQSSKVAYPWVLYWFTGMTEEEIYNLAIKSFEIYKDVDTSSVTWTSPESIDSKTGIVSCKWVSGVQVTENIKELWKALDDNGIDVWVCSASCTAAIRAAIDIFGLHDFCTGMVAMTNKTDESGRYIAQYDMETGCGFYANKDGTWTKMTRPTKTQMHGVGKVNAIVNAIAPEYGNRGPIAGFMDATGDFNFCTEFKTLKLVVCFNRADRKVTDGGGLIAEVAIYEKNTLGYDLTKANAAGDTLYLLQGRDENGKRSFINNNGTILLGSQEEKLFRNDNNETQLQRMIDDNMTVADILNTFSIKKEAGKNGFDFNTGFVTEYAGYHSHD